MQKIMIAMIVGALLLAGCSAKQVEDRLDEAGDLVGDGLDKIMDTTSSTGEARKISEEEAIAAALKHAGTTQDKVTGLRTEYEVDTAWGITTCDFCWMTKNIITKCLPPTEKSYPLSGTIEIF